MMAWSGLALALPIGVIFALLSIKDKPVASYEQPLAEALPEIVASTQNENVLINLRSDQQNQQYQVEAIVLKPMATPAPALFYDPGMDMIPLAEHLIGSLGPRGLYRFPILRNQAKENLRLVIFDVIKKEPIYHLQLKGGRHGG